jgi:hypothetical protein
MEFIKGYARRVRSACEVKPQGYFLSALMPACRRLPLHRFRYVQSLSLPRPVVARTNTCPTNFAPDIEFADAFTIVRGPRVAHAMELLGQGVSDGQIEVVGG